MSLQEDLVLLAQIKQQIKDLEEQHLAVEKRMTDELSARLKPGAKSTSVTAFGLRGTGVFGSTVVIDQDGLLNDLTAQQRKKVTKPVLDKEMLEACMATGDIDPNVVALHSEERPSKPYVRVTGTYKPPKVTRRVRPKKATA